MCKLINKYIYLFIYLKKNNKIDNKKETKKGTLAPSIYIKEVNSIPKTLPIWPPVRYISDTGQYQYTVSGLPLFYIFNICIYTHTPTQTHPHRQINIEIHKHTQCFCNWAKFCHILFNNTKIIYKKIINAHTVLHVIIH